MKKPVRKNWNEAEETALKISKSFRDAATILSNDISEDPSKASSADRAEILLCSSPAQTAAMRATICAFAVELFDRMDDTQSRLARMQSRLDFMQSRLDRIALR